MKPSLFSATLNAVIVSLASGLRDSFRIAAFSLSNKPNMPSCSDRHNKLIRSVKVIYYNVGTTAGVPVYKYKFGTSMQYVTCHATHILCTTVCY